jgi:hypothetical protein
MNDLPVWILQIKADNKKALEVQDKKINQIVNEMVHQILRMMNERETMKNKLE